MKSKYYGWGWWHISWQIIAVEFEADPRKSGVAIDADGNRYVGDFGRGWCDTFEEAKACWVAEVELTVVVKEGWLRLAKENVEWVKGLKEQGKQNERR